jgi:tetratricopeptide (TPR) repeat protein
MQVYLNFGAGYLMTGSTPRAIQMFRRGLECPNGAPDLRSKLENNLGSALVTIGDIDGAVRFYHQAIDDNPLNSSAHSNLGKVLASLGRNAEAKEHYQIALHLNPNDTATRDLLNQLIPLGDHGDRSR